MTYPMFMDSHEEIASMIRAYSTLEFQNRIPK